ncbi:MAG: dipeptidase [bacterium]
MKQAVVIGTCLILVSWGMLSAQTRKASTLSEEDLAALAKKIHERIITIDTHDDISQEFATERNDPGSPENRRQVSLPKMRSGGLDAEFFAVFTGNGQRTPAAWDTAYARAIRAFEAIHRLPTMRPSEIEIAYSPADVIRIHNGGKLIACIGVENGYPLGMEISRVKEFYNRGARYITLTHSGHNQICDSSTPRPDELPEEHHGLSEYGRLVVAEMNRLGIMVDISHASKKAALDVLKFSKAPIIASHSGADAVNASPRNVDDETLLAIKNNGGVVQCVALASYIKTVTETPERHAAIAELRKELGLPAGRDGSGRRQAQQMTEEQRRQNQEQMAKFRERMPEIDKTYPPQKISVQDMVNHIDYMVNVMGIDHVGIGTDFDGGGGLTGFKDASESLNVTLELVRRGYTEEEIGKIWGGNLLRVWRAVEKTAKEMN